MTLLRLCETRLKNPEQNTCEAHARSPVHDCVALVPFTACHLLIVAFNIGRVKVTASTTMLTVISKNKIKFITVLPRVQSKLH